MATLYDVKPRFQALLRPLVGRLASAGITANQVTLAACALSGAAGLALWSAGSPKLFLILPVVLLLRMALNAIDGMLAREHGQASRLGMYLNELCDVISDLALTLPFCLVFQPLGVIAFALVAVIAEFAGVLGIPAGAGRRYDGPLGKSDRAAVLGVLGIIVGLGWPMPTWLASAIFPALALLSAVTVINRVRQGLTNAVG